MTTNMYIFYDKDFEIKGISPTTTNDNGYSIVMLPIGDVEDFLLGKKPTFAYRIEKYEKKSGTAYRIVKKEIERNYTRTETSFLSKIETTTTDALIVISRNINKNTVTIESSVLLQNKFINGTAAEQENLLGVFSDSLSMIYMTTENNPYCLLAHFSFNPRLLLENNILTHEYNSNYDTVSFYTKKLAARYVEKK